MKKKKRLAPPKGKLAILIVGLSGAVSSTMIAGIELIKQRKAEAVGSQALMGKIRLGKRTEKRQPLIRDLIALAEPEDVVFGGWDVRGLNVLEGARTAGVLTKEHIEAVSEELSSIKPMTAVFEQKWAPNLKGDHIKPQASKMEWSESIQEDIERFKRENDCSRAVVIWVGSTEIHLNTYDVHRSMEAFERGLYDSDENISPAQIYAHAALTCKVPFINGSPGNAVDIPAMVELAKKMHVPIAGKDLKTGQTLMKTMIAPGLKARLLGLAGWFSTNILGNLDGEVLDNPDNNFSKTESKGSVLHSILDEVVYPTLYKAFTHIVKIIYYPPRGDDKEGWDNIDIFGWLGYKMQIKIDFLCKDSILAAPVIYDLAIFMDLAQRSEMEGIQEWLSFYFKVPQVAEGLVAENDLFIQLMKFKNTLRFIAGEELITHLGREYYD